MAGARLEKKMDDIMTELEQMVVSLGGMTQQQYMEQVLSISCTCATFTTE